MKIVKVLLASMFVLGVSKPVSALDFDFSKVKPFGSLDIFTAANAGDRLESRLKAAKKGSCITAGNPTGDARISAYKLNTDGAVGFRVGALYPVEDIGDVGFSWGYIKGPNGDMKMTEWDGSINKQDINRRFYRFLAEGRRNFKYSDKISFLGGAGLGVAYGREEFENTTPGAELQRTEDGKAYEPTKSDKYFSGLAWELTAGVAYKATDKLNVEAGLKYAGFPSNPADPAQTRVGEPDANDGNFPGMNWTTLGFFVGVGF